MSEIVRNRVIRPSTRAESSDSYKIDTEAVSHFDTLLVNVTHESFGIKAIYKFEGNSVADRNSIHFRVQEDDHRIIISWKGISPFEICSSSIDNGEVEIIHRLYS
jgi:hypothetical protein